MKTQTFDRPSPFYAPQSIGKTRRITPEGFLLCEGVAIARVGTQVYSVAELPALEGDVNGLIHIERTADEVFRPESVASWQGKAITIRSHPDEFVTPLNWRGLSVGTVQNPRRGTGTESDLLLCDLLFTDAAAIEYVNRELPELSGGYEAEYEQTAPGRGLQRNIVGNHVAALKSGRAGRRCAIKDEESTFVPFTVEELSMKNKPLITRLLASFGVKDADAAAEVLAQASEAASQSVPTADAAASAQVSALQSDVTTLKSDLAGIKDLIAKLVPAEPVAPVVQTTDKALELDSEALTAITSRAEILAPGIAIPSNDALKTADGLKGLLVGALNKAIATTDGAAHVQPFLLGREVKALTGEALLGVFNGAAELARAKNNAKVAVAAKNPFATSANPFVGTKDGAPVTVADRVRLQQQSYQDFWNKQKAS